MNKITFEHLIRYGVYASQWIEKEENKNTKQAYAIEKFGKTYQKYAKPHTEIKEDCQAEINDAYTEFASEDANGNIDRLIVKDDKGIVTYTENKYTRENKKLCDAKIRAITKKYTEKLEQFLLTEVEIQPYYCPSVPSNLTNQEREAFEGIVLAPTISDDIRVGLNGESKYLQEA